ncbi:hypothetical protein [Ralstonia pseudosolanacearum]|uniref:Transmembrane protein n=2 Tax=Ralstonia solanacearum species complex TaxID=3116862 RepID=A0AA92K5B7_RALSL|nr:hypothetical protein [Ralstonia pseudosolanacearum]QOK98847.1 hypothetical protein HF909_20720 [Ralstonia pseudosolanacearum]CAH0439968.1 hypothetical protein LMG9673_00751 [Ralstonia pseudosolanacearum]
MAKSELEGIFETFASGNGFGNPDDRRNAELRLQVALAEQQRKTAARLNLLTLLLVVVGCLQVAVLTFQGWGK